MVVQAIASAPSRPNMSDRVIAREGAALVSHLAVLVRVTPVVLTFVRLP
jgi:hypothetical protein